VVGGVTGTVGGTGGGTGGVGSVGGTGGGGGGGGAAAGGAGAAGAAGAAGMDVPHSPQKRDPSGFWAPQLGQFTAPDGTPDRDREPGKRQLPNIMSHCSTFLGRNT
jgi:hypothetical protein